MNTPLTTDELAALIRSGENLTVEFKGEHREALSDREIYEAVVCLANGEGGTLLIGVEDDGRITGARARHGTTTDPARLQVAIFNNTMPNIQTHVALYEIEEETVIAMRVMPCSHPCATADGKSLRRSITSHGKPQCVPCYPHEHSGKMMNDGVSDYSSATLDADWADLDPLEIERLRQTIRRLHGDGVLLELDDRELAKALRLVETQDGKLMPNVTGVLLLGREEALRRMFPTHSIAFQVLDARGEVKMNDWFYGPLLKSLEAIQERFQARNQEQEVQVGMLRMPIPDYAPAAFRRIGLVETTGRGIDNIYMGQLRYGRPLPDYARSDAKNVRLILQGGKENLVFTAFVHEQDKLGKRLQIDELLVLNHFHHQRRVDIRTIGKLTQRGDAFARSLMERLVERGLVEPHGEKKGRVYHLGAQVYKNMGAPAAYVHAHGFEPIQQEQMVLQYLNTYKKIKRAEAIALCKISPKEATTLLNRMTKKGLMLRQGKKRGSHYILSLNSYDPVMTQL